MMPFVIFNTGSAEKPLTKEQKEAVTINGRQYDIELKPKVLR